MDARKSQYKKGLDNDSCRRRRGEESVVIRKQKREESLSKRRFLAFSPQDDASTIQPAATQGLPAATAAGSMPGTAAPQAPAAAATARPTPPGLTELPRLAAELRSGNPQLELEATRAVRRLLSVEQKPPVNEVLQAGALPLLVSFLQRGTAPSDLLFEAAWALTNIASTDHTRALVDAGATEPLAGLLLHSSADVREQAAWCLGNIAGDCATLRDVVLTSGALGSLLKNILQPSSTSMLRNCVWALSNLFRGKPQPHIDVLRPALPVLAKLLAACQDADCLQDAGWALSYISDGDNQRIQAVIDSGVGPDLVRHLAHTQANVVTPMLRTLGNLVSGDDSQTQAVIDAGALNYMPALLRNSKKNIRKETCWLLSNVAAGNAHQVAALVGTQSVLHMVITQMSSGEWDVRKEAAWVVSNVATGGTPAHVAKLVECGALRPLCDLLEVGDAKVVEVALDGIEAILRAGEASGLDFVTMLHEAEGPERLERLQAHANERIYERSVQIIERYLGVEDEEEQPGGHGHALPGQENLRHAANGTFGFAAHQPAGAFAAAGAAAAGGFNFANVPRMG